MRPEGHVASVAGDRGVITGGISLYAATVHADDGSGTGYHVMNIYIAPIDALHGHEIAGGRVEHHVASIVGNRRSQTEQIRLVAVACYADTGGGACHCVADKNVAVAIG